MHDAHDTDQLEVINACDAKEPVVDCWLYTQGARGGIGPELATSTQMSEQTPPGVHLGRVEIAHCLALWAEHYERGPAFGQALLYDGLVTVTVTGTEVLTAEQLAGANGPHLCLLDEDEPVLVVSWAAALSYDETDAGDHVLEEQDANAQGAAHVTQQVARVLEAPTPDTATRVWDVLLDHFDPQHATLDTALALGQLGSHASIQVEVGIGASNVLARLRTLAEQRDEPGLLDAAEAARDHAAAWSSVLWPPSCTGFERRFHLLSVGLSHAFEATVLALGLYPDIDIGTLNVATMTTMTALAGSRWAASTARLESALTLREELAGLSDDTWRALGTSCLAVVGSEDPRVAELQATLLGSGARIPHPEDFTTVVPTWLDPEARDAVLAALATSAVRRHRATADGDLTVGPYVDIDAARSDLVTTVLVGRSLFET